MTTQKQISYQDKKISYQTVGEGPAIVLLHGFGGDGATWKNQLNLFPHYKLIIPDLPGSGASESIDDTSMEGLAAAVKSIVEKEINRGEKITLLGHSMGGYITLSFVDQYPALIGAFGLIHSSAYADNEEKIETRKKGIQSIRDIGAYPFLKTLIPNLYSPTTKEQKPELVEQHIESSRGFTNEALTGYYEAMIERPDRTQVLKDASVPVFFLGGRHDTVIPIQDTLEQCHLPKLSYIHILENSGHMGMTEEAEELNKSLMKFISFVNEHRT
ncbi:MAG TPA: alpha/beta hydrolase [Flavisolibacter sp.]|nr:alpha/beta hydrolase [Flavisolibacter sp.]